MIRNAVIHLSNEQPLLADLLSQPAPRDVSLLCTNLRTMNGKAPVFVDDQHSVFAFPYTQVRFVEVPAGARNLAVPDDAGQAEVGGPAPAVSGPDHAPSTAPDEELELDEDFLRRVREV